VVILAMNSTVVIGEKARLCCAISKQPALIFGNDADCRARLTVDSGATR
jgi:hypothetical protein